MIRVIISLEVEFYIKAIFEKRQKFSFFTSISLESAFLDEIAHAAIKVYVGLLTNLKNN